MALSLFLGGVTYDSYRMATAENDIRTAVDAELENPDYSEHELVELEVRAESRYVLFQRPQNVTVTVGVPPDTARPGLADALERRLATRHDIDVTVNVLYLEIERSE